MSSDSDDDNAAQAAWPMFAHDAAHTGRSTQSGPTIFQRSWSASLLTRMNTIQIDQAGYIYASGIGRLCCLDQDGNIKGTYRDAYYPVGVIGPDGTMYTSGTNEVAAWQWKDSKFTEKWRNNRDIGIVRAPITLAPDGTIYVVNSGEYDPRETPALNYFLALDSANGNLKWKVSRPESSTSAIAVAPSGDVIACDEKNIYALTQKDGSLKWTKPLDGHITTSPVIDEDGNIYLTILAPPNPETVCVFDAEGNPLWTYPESWSYPLTSAYLNVLAQPALGPNGVIYAAVQNQIHAITWDGNSKFGKASWRRKLKTGERPGPITVDRNGNIYFSTELSLYAFDANGGLLWRVAPLWVTQPLIAPNGAIVFFDGHSAWLRAIGPDPLLPSSLSELWSDIRASSRPSRGDGEKYTLSADTVTNQTIWKMIAAAIGTSVVTINTSTLKDMSSGLGYGISLTTAADGLRYSDGKVSLSGVGTFGGKAGAQLQFVFSQSGNDVQMDFSVTPGPDWVLSDSFSALSLTLFDQLDLGSSQLSQTATTSQPATEWKFTSTLALSGPLSPVASLLGSMGPKQLSGTITFEQDFPILDFTVGTKATPQETYPLALIGGLTLDTCVGLTTTYLEDYETIVSAVALISQLTVAGQTVPVTAELPLTDGLTTFEGTLAEPPVVTLDQMDIWGGDENLTELLPTSMQANLPGFKLSRIELTLLTENRKVTSFRAELAVIGNWSAIAPPAGTGVEIAMTAPKLQFSAIDPFDARRAFGIVLTGDVPLSIGTLPSISHRPDYDIFSGTLPFEQSLNAGQVVKQLVGSGVSLPDGLDDFAIDEVGLNADTKTGNYYFRFNSPAQWEIATSLPEFIVDNLGFGINRLHSSPTSDECFLSVTILGLVVFADRVFGISGANPASGADWSLSGPVTLPLYLPLPSEVVTACNADWNDALPEVITSWGESYTFAYLGVTLATPANKLEIVLAQPDGWAGWQLILDPFPLELKGVTVELACNDSVTGWICGGFPVAERPIFLRTSLPFDSTDFELTLNPEPPVSEIEEDPIPPPPVRSIVALVKQDWANNLPPAVGSLGDKISIDIFSVTVKDEETQVTINVSATEDTASWTIIDGQPGFSLIHLQIALADSFDGSEDTRTGYIKGDLAAGPHLLPLQTALSDNWSSFTVSLDQDALKASELVPTVDDLIGLFDASWVSALPDAVTNAAVTIQNFDLKRTPELSTATTILVSPSDWSWTAISGSPSVTINDFSLELSFDQPATANNPSGILSSSANILSQAVNLKQPLPQTILTGSIEGQVSLVDIVHYFIGNSAGVPDYLQSVEFDHLIVRLDEEHNKLTIEGLATDDIVVPRNDEDHQLDECGGDYPKPPDSVLKHARVTGTYTSHDAATVCLTGDFMWNTGVEVPGSLCHPFSSFSPALANDLTYEFSFPPPIDPSGTAAISQDEALQKAQALMAAGQSPAAAVLTIAQSSGLSPETAIQTLYQLYGNTVEMLDLVTADFTRIYLSYACDPDETAAEVAAALATLAAGAVALSAGILSLALGAAFVGLSATALAEALGAAVAALAPLGVTLAGFGSTLPSGVTVPAISCDEIIKQLAGDNFAVANTARILRPQSKCTGETQDATSMIKLLNGAYPLLSCDDLAAALASAAYTASQTAAALYQSTNCQNLNEKPDAPEMAATLVDAYSNPPLTCLQLAQAMAAAGYTASQVSPVLIGQAVCAKELQSTAALAEVLLAAYPAVTCPELAGALAAAQCEITSVSRLLKSLTTTCGALSAADMATILTSAFTPSLSCTDLAQAIAEAGYDVSEVAAVLQNPPWPTCVGKPSSAADMATLLMSAYAAPSLSCIQLTQALANAGYPASDVAAVITQQSICSDCPKTASDLTGVMQTACPTLTCPQLAAILAADGYDPATVASVLRQDQTLCENETSTAGGMVNLLEKAFGLNLTCQQIAQALAAAKYDPAATAYALVHDAMSICTGKLESASDMASLLIACYPDLACNQLATALVQAGYALNDVAALLVESQYQTRCGNQTNDAFSMASMLVQAYPSSGLDCSYLLPALASANYAPAAAVAAMMRNSGCLDPPASAGSLANRVLEAYPEINCEQLAQSLAVGGFTATATAIELSLQSTCGTETASTEAFAQLLYEAYRIPDLNPTAMADALQATGAQADETASAVKSLYPTEMQSAAAMADVLTAAYGTALDCTQLAQALAAASYDPSAVALAVQTEADLCGTQTAGAMASLLSSAFKSALTCDSLAKALAATNYSADDVAAVITQEPESLCGAYQDAGNLATLLMSLYSNPRLSCVQLAQALQHGGFDPAAVAPVLTQQPPICLDQPDNVLTLALLLQRVYPAINCAGLAAALAAANYEALIVGPLLASDTTVCTGETAGQLASLLVRTYPELSCQQLAQALAQTKFMPGDVAAALQEQPVCGNDFTTASATVSFMEKAYQGIGIGVAEMAQALEATGFSASVTAAQLHETYPAATRTAYTMAAILLQAYDKLDCTTLASALASAGYGAMEVAITLRDIPRPLPQICTGVTDTPTEMTALLLPLYPDLTCQQLAQVLAGAGYDPSSVAAALKTSTNSLCSGQTKTAAAMSEILMSAYRDRLTEDQLDAALTSAGYPELQIQVVNQVYAQGRAWSMYLGNAQHTTRSRATGPSALNIIWQKPFNYPNNGVAVDAQGNLYFGTATATAATARIYCLDSAGNTVWTYDDTADSPAVDGPLPTPAIGADGTIYGTNNQVFAVKPAAGQLTQTSGWRYNPQNDDPQRRIWRTFGAPVVGPDGTIYAVFQDLSFSGDISFADENILAAINPDGTKKWWFSIPVLASPPAIAPDGSIILAQMNGEVLAIDPDLVTSRSIYKPDSQLTGISSPAVTADGIVYLLTTSNAALLIAVDLTGTPRWQQPYSGGLSFPGAAVGVRADGVIYAGFTNLHAVSPDGTKLWETNQNGIAVGLAIDSAGNAYFGVQEDPLSGDPAIVAVDNSGNQSWIYKPANSACAPAIGPDGTVYVSDLSGNVIAIAPP